MAKMFTTIQLLRRIVLGNFSKFRYWSTGGTYVQSTEIFVSREKWIPRYLYPIIMDTEIPFKDKKIQRYLYSRIMDTEIPSKN